MFGLFLIVACSGPVPAATVPVPASTSPVPAVTDLPPPAAAGSPSPTVSASPSNAASPFVPPALVLPDQSIRRIDVGNLFVDGTGNTAVEGIAFHGPLALVQGGPSEVGTPSEDAVWVVDLRDGSSRRVSVARDRWEFSDPRLDGRIAAWTESQCPRPLDYAPGGDYEGCRWRIRLFDLDTNESTIVAEGSRTPNHRGRIDPPFLAIRFGEPTFAEDTTETIVVTDMSTGREVQRVELSTPVWEFGLQDGVLLYTAGPCMATLGSGCDPFPSALWVAHPGLPAERIVENAQDFAVADGRIAWRWRADDPNDPPASTWALHDPVVRLLSPLGAPVMISWEATTPAVSGDLVAWTDPRDDDPPAVVLWDAADGQARDVLGPTDVVDLGLGDGWLTWLAVRDAGAGLSFRFEGALLEDLQPAP